VERVRIASVDEREGGRGKMVFVAEESMLTTSEGDPILRSTNRLVFRPHPVSASTRTAARPPALSVMKPATTVLPTELIKRPSMVSLFMFCAAIWAVHRIHYDDHYAQSEGLPAAILPGWLMASYLCQFASLQAGQGRRLARLAVKYRAYGHAGDVLTCRSASGADEEMDLRITNASGEELVTGVANLRPV
jgi:hydroxyacyl-ACP dehydratase HTD2-like protein with hotdog domain